VWLPKSASPTGSSPALLVRVRRLRSIVTEHMRKRSGVVSIEARREEDTGGGAYPP